MSIVERKAKVGKLRTRTRTRRRWRMPGWMKPYSEYIVNTGGNDIEEMVNGDADPFVNLPLSTLQACVKSQVALLERLHRERILAPASRVNLSSGTAVALAESKGVTFG